MGYVICYLSIDFGSCFVQSLFAASRSGPQDQRPSPLSPTQGADPVGPDLRLVGANGFKLNSKRKNGPDRSLPPIRATRRIPEVPQPRGAGTFLSLMFCFLLSFANPHT